MQPVSPWAAFYLLEHYRYDINVTANADAEDRRDLSLRLTNSKS